MRCLSLKLAAVSHDVRPSEDHIYGVAGKSSLQTD